MELVVAAAALQVVLAAGAAQVVGPVVAAQDVAGRVGRADVLDGGQRVELAGGAVGRGVGEVDGHRLRGPRARGVGLKARLKPVHDGVDAGPAVDRVVAEVPEERVVAGCAREPVVARAAVELGPGDRVVAIAAADDGRGGEHVVARVARHRDQRQGCGKGEPVVAVAERHAPGEARAAHRRGVDLRAARPRGQRRAGVANDERASRGRVGGDVVRLARRGLEGERASAGLELAGGVLAPVVDAHGRGVRGRRGGEHRECEEGQRQECARREPYASDPRRATASLATRRGRLAPRVFSARCGRRVPSRP